MTVGLFMPTKRTSNITKFASFIGVEHYFTSIPGGVNQDTLTHLFKYDRFAPSKIQGQTDE